MKKAFEIGPGLSCDVDRLVASRLLVQANSGGGKTRTLRRLLEQSHGRLQHLVIDPEGEYHTQRERFDYILAAPAGGDVIAHPRTAALLAERLLQLGVSAILDIYELNPDDRLRFVQRFLEALVNAPRALWHPTLIVLDEAHVYAPEGKENASTAAVKAMASRGRKRGFCLVPATQRLAKLSKDVAAECNNKLIGRCTLDVDLKRAAEELGFSTAEQKASLRQLEPGQFYAYGPAFDVKAPQLVHVGAVRTTHAEAGQQAAPAPPPTDKVRKVLAQLADLPIEAESRERSVADLQALVATQARRIKALEAAKPAAAPVPASPVVQPLSDADRALLGKVAAALVDVQDGVTERVRRAEERAHTIVVEAVAGALKAQGEAVHGAGRALEAVFERAGVRRVLEDLSRLAASKAPVVVPRPVPASTRPAAAHRAVAPAVTDGTVSGPQQRILNALAWGEALGLGALVKTQLALLADASPTSSAFSNNLGALRSAGFIDYPAPGRVGLRPEGQARAEATGVPQSSADLQRALFAKLPAPQVRILEALVACYPDALPKDDLAMAAGASPSSSAFSNNLGALRSLGLIDYPQRGTVAALAVLFIEGRA